MNENIPDTPAGSKKDFAIKAYKQYIENNIKTSSRLIIEVELFLTGVKTNIQGLEKIIIDTLPFINKVIIYECKNLLDDPQSLKEIDCNSKPLHQTRANKIQTISLAE
ncbi:hypothetical protein BCV71DRAFT_238936 [Rhizopus microsporus]|uniref:Uncharacterized protein n=1 Tax=Rhizopus microsporus TaxID=58291 RepID=A0A1X0RP89_RHIZD|nr:hypothetical protein BCV71DRAFT_238936 [Rhizopus microsporus]